MAHVLCGLEDTEGQGSQEVSGCQQTGSWTEGESSVLAEEVADVFQLWDAVRHEDICLLKLAERRLVFPAGVLRHQFEHGVEHSLPSRVLGFGVSDGRDRVSVLVSECDLRNVLPALSVLLVSKPRVVHVELRLVFGHQVVAVVEIGSVAREPRGFVRDVVVGEKVDASEGGRLAQGSDELQQVAASHAHFHQSVKLHARYLGGARLEVFYATLVVVDSFEDASEGAHSIAHTKQQSGFLNRLFGLRALACSVL